MGSGLRGRWWLTGFRKMQENTVLHLPLVIICDTPENLDPRPSILPHPSATRNVRSGFYNVFTAGTPPQPTNWLDSRRRMELGWGETPQGGQQKRPFTGGSDTLVLFLGLLVAVTGTCFLHLSDPYEAADRYRGCRENKGEGGGEHNRSGKKNSRALNETSYISFHSGQVTGWIIHPWLTNFKTVKYPKPQELKNLDFTLFASTISAKKEPWKVQNTNRTWAANCLKGKVWPTYDEEEYKANNEERGATDDHSAGKIDEWWKQQCCPKQEVEQRPQPARWDNCGSRELAFLIVHFL